MSLEPPCHSAYRSRLRPRAHSWHCLGTIFLLLHGKNRTFLTASSLVRRLRSLPCAWWQDRMRMLRVGKLTKALEKGHREFSCRFCFGHPKIPCFVIICPQTCGIFMGFTHGIDHILGRKPSEVYRIVGDIHPFLLFLYPVLHPVVPFPWAPKCPKMRPWRGLHCNILDAAGAAGRNNDLEDEMD